MTRQYLGGGDANEICPSANGGGFMLSHQPYRFDEVDHQHDSLLLYELHAWVTHVGSLGPGGLSFRFVKRVIVHVDPAPQA
jgi:hypothetical protein